MTFIRILLVSQFLDIKENKMNNDYSNQFIQEVHNNLQTAETPKKRLSRKSLLIVLGLIVVVGILAVGVVVLINNLTQERQLEQFKDGEAALVQKTEEIFSDPAFSVLPYYDSVGDFYIDVWGTDEGIIVKILPLCNPERYGEYTQEAQDWLSEQLGDLSKYKVEVASCDMIK